MSNGIPRELIARRAALELHSGQTVNLGIGLPTLVASHLEQGAGIVLQAENGILGYGGVITDEDHFDPDLINAGGQPVQLLPGACFFDSAASFAMIRGGHVDVAILGGLQVSSRGDLANWMVPARGGGSIGGAMDLAVGAKRVIVVMEHTSKDGGSRLVEQCTYPLTAAECVHLVITNLGRIEVTTRGFLLTEVAPGVAVDEVIAKTDAPLEIDARVSEMRFT